MAHFEFSHKLPEDTELVNGNYGITALKDLKLDDKTILYYLGEATLDNSCCGMTHCTYALVIGEIIRTKKSPEEKHAVSTVAQITQVETKNRIKYLVQQQEQLDTVNFYLPAS